MHRYKFVNKSLEAYNHISIRHVKSPENRGRVMEKQLFSRLTKFFKKSHEKNENPNFGLKRFEKLRL